MVSSSSAALSAPPQVLPVLQQPAEIISRSLPAETPQNASYSNPDTTLGMTQALSLSRSQQANNASPPDHCTRPCETTAEQLQGQPLTIGTVRSASPNRLATQQLRTVPADLLTHNIQSSATQSGHVEPASSQSIVLPPQSGAITSLLQNDQGINLVESHAEATGHAAAVQLGLARWPKHSNDPQEPQQWQKQQQQQQQQPPSQQQHATTEPLSRQRTGPNASPSLQTPSLSSMLPLVAAGDDSIWPLSGKKRSTRLRSSRKRPSSSIKLRSGSFSSPSDLPSHWQTLGDVLQDMNLNDITVKGCPLRKGAEVYAVAPLTPMTNISSTAAIRYLQLPLAACASATVTLEIASSARHLLKNLEVAGDATSTSAIEYRTSSALMCEEVRGTFHNAFLHEDPKAGQEDQGFPEVAAQNAAAAETADEAHGPGGQQHQAASIGTQHATSSAECVSPDALSDDAAPQDNQYTELRAAGFTADEIEESADKAAVRESSVADLPNEADVLQVAALMSGKHSLGVEDLYSVCAHWQQTAGPYHKVLQNFGSSDPVAACHHIQIVLGESGRFVMCGQTRAGVMQWCLRHLDGVGSSRDQAEPWLASGQDLIDRMEQSRAAGLEEQACSRSKKRKIRPEWHQVKLASAPHQKPGESTRKADARLESSPCSRRTVAGGTNKQQLLGTDLPVVSARGPPTSSKAQCTASDSALAALPDLTALVNEDTLQHHFTAEEQHALLRLLPKADQQAASAGYNPLASTQFKAAAASYLQLLQTGLLEDEGASCWLPARCRCPMDERHREARVQRWASTHFGQDAARALTNGHTTAVELVMNIPTSEAQAMTL
ncbi:hypothetical protein WJX79_002127 [Trebouxia sp. C0005]